MRSISEYARRLLITGGFAAAAALPAIGFAVAVPSNAPSQFAYCPPGEETDLYSTHCIPYVVPNSPDSATGTSAASSDLCPPGVSGAECTPSTGGELGSPQPAMPAPVPPQQPEQQLAEVVTPDY